MRALPFPARMRAVLFIALLALSGSAHALTPSELDTLIDRIWATHGITPAPTSSDSEFFRRVYLDLAGEPPSVEETVNFLTSNEPNKRAKAIEQLLATREYGDHHGRVWTNLILEGRVLKRRFPRERFDSYLADSFNKNKPFDDLVKELIAVEGSSADNGATFLILSHEGKPEDLTSTSARLFLGTQLRCAQCHDDKFGPWKQEQFWGFAAFFARVETRPEKSPLAKRPESFLVTDRPRGEAIIPEDGATPSFKDLPPEERRKARMALEREMRTHPVRPAFLGQPVDLHPRDHRRKALAERIVRAPDNLFARTQVNRVWAEMFGAGLIEPLDDLYGKTAGDWEPVLQALASHFIESGHRMKSLYALIANTKAYQLTSEGQTESNSLREYFARARLRPLSPEALFQTILKTTNVESTASATRKARLEQEKQRYLERFVFVFGNDEGEKSTAFEGTIPQALMMMNDPLIERGLAPLGGTTLHRILESSQSVSERIRFLYLGALSREPSVAEMKDAQRFLVEASPEPIGDARAIRPRDRLARMREAEAYQDLLWSLMNSAEFLYNH
ncbi:MAG: hypothetical protein GHCLOJNM_01129 [bacterium]|nr:hypothetical protein [bacterium]